jgi:type IV secretion system protein TrbL
MANDVSARVFTETNGLSMWSVSTYVEAIVSGLAGILIWLGLSVTGLLAILAEFQLLIGAAVAPLILPALAFGFTTPIGWGAVTFMVSAGVRVVVMGTVSYVMASAVTAVIAVPGSDVPLTYEQMVTLLGVALLTALVGFCCNGLARDLVSGSPGSLGWGSVVRTGGTVGAVASIGGGVAGGAVTAGAGMARGAVAAGTNLARGFRGAARQGSGGGQNGTAGALSGNGASDSGSNSQAAGLGTVSRSSGTGSPFD